MNAPSVCLPKIQHAATCRELESTRVERFEFLRGNSVARIRYASPPHTARAEFPRLMNKPTCSQEDETERVGKDKIMLINKQQQSLETFRQLYQLQKHATNESMKSMLEQIYTILVHATYHSDSRISDPNDHLIGSEYFTLFTRAQHMLNTTTHRLQQLETKYEMEKSLESELTNRLEQLDHDLYRIRTHHLEHHESVETERMQVNQLEQEYSRLIQQEQELQHECEQLQEQVDQQRHQLQELQAQSTYLDFISRVPLKKHMEETKWLERQIVIDHMVEQEETENIKLGQELERLEAQNIALDEQYAQEITSKNALTTCLLEIEQERDLLETECQHAKRCHTPRPDWDRIIKQIPELSFQRYDWNLRPSTNTLLDDYDSDNDEIKSNDPPIKQTEQLVHELLHWMERLQTHCGMNVHMSRLWHDVEEARIELAMIQQQLERAIRKQVQQRDGNDSNHINRMTHKQEYILALGTHEEIPAYLRHQGKVKHRYLTKVQVETIIRQVWSEKRQRELRNHVHLSLPTVLYDRFHRKYGFQPLIAEWGYNLLMALNSYCWDAEIELFLLVLTHAISDAVYMDQETMLTCCRTLLIQLSKSYLVDPTTDEPRILVKDGLVMLRKFFPLKTPGQLQAIEKAMLRDMHKKKRNGNDTILYIDDILPSQLLYPHGFFVKTLRTQHFKEIQDYYKLLHTELIARDRKKTGTLSLEGIHEVMMTIDPLVNGNTVINALMRGMGVKSRTLLCMEDIVDYRELIRRMNVSGLLKFTLNYDPQAEVNWQFRRPSIDTKSGQAFIDSPQQPNLDPPEKNSSM